MRKFSLSMLGESVRMGAITLDDTLAPGQARELMPDEARELYRCAGMEEDA